MIAHWMLYCAAIGVLLCAGAAAAERALRGLGRPVRWAWAAAIVLTLAIPAAARWLPRALPRAMPVPAVTVDAAAPATLPAIPSAPAEAPRRIDLGALDRPLALAWTGSTLAAVLALLAAWAVLERRRRRWRAAEVDGVPVLLSPRTGPAVVGLFRSRIVVPEWVVSDAEPEVRALLLEHEREHLRAGDPRLLALGLAAAALMPWNPAAWWQLRRLRLAVEMDCDARVLARRGDVRTYGALLLEVGRRASSADRMITVAAFSEPASFLERRIRMMTLPRGRRPLLRAAAFGGMAAVLAAAACRAPGPARPAPVDARRPAPAENTPAQAAAGEADAVMIPALATTVQGEAVLVPATTIMTTAETVIVPATASTRAAEAVVVPGTATRPAEAFVIPATATTRPVDEVIVAGAATTARPVDGVIVTTTATTRPGAAVMVPARATTRPVDGVIVTTTATTLPGDAIMVPARATTRPAEAVVVPGTATTRPAGAVIAPARATTRPAESVVVPGTATPRPAVAPATTTPRRDTVPATVVDPQAVSRALQREYPTQLRAAGIEGTAVLELRLAADGSVARTRIVESSHPAFGEAAVRALADTRFRPARHQGAAVATTVVVPLQFRLSRGDVPPVSARAERSGAISSGAAAAERTYDQPPVPVNQQEIVRALNAEYPPMLRAAGIAADAQVRVRVAATGEVVGAEPVQASHPEAGRAAARALSTARFRPARKDGRAVAAEVVMPVQFRLDTAARP